MEKIIFVSGVSGIGKTTLANYISQRYQIPFISGSSKVLWEKYNIKSHLDLIEKCNKDSEFALAFQHELLIYRQEMVENNSQFVTDRSPLDNLMYFMLQVSPFINREQNQGYIDACYNAFPKKPYKQIFLEFNQDIYSNQMGGIEDDNMRITNPWYQNLCNSVYQTLITEDWLSIMGNKDCELIHMNVWDWNKRIKVVDNMFNKNNQWLQDLKGKLRL